jgi:ssDNA-binding Zn-finger/Zn-ribbon topoisomerase 1
MLETRGDSTFRLLKKGISKPVTIRKAVRTKEGSAPVCPKCGSEMRLVKPQGSDHWKAFWGCSKYRVTGCKGSIGG